jgi:DtxR family Mn-dependent transcriptional regulator
LCRLVRGRALKCFVGRPPLQGPPIPSVESVLVLTKVNKPEAMPDRSAERARQDYVKAIYQLGGGSPVSGADLARYLALSRAAVTKSRRILERQQLVKSALKRTDRIELTARGRTLGSNMLRRHRLIETFLHRCLHVPIDKLHAQAEAIEHVISDDVASRLARYMGNPREDPHGHPIGARARDTGRAKTMSLADVPVGSRIRIDSIPDRDPRVVRKLSAERVLPGLVAVVAGHTSRKVTLRSDRAVHAVPAPVAPLVTVTPAAPAQAPR